MQLTELRQYAAARGWTVSDEYVDTGFSGKTANRPQLKRCLADAKLRRFDGVLVWKLDRWARSVAQLSADILTLDSSGIRFICPSQGIDTDQSNSMSRLTINVLAAFAQFERDVIHERISSGVKQYRADFDAGKVGKSKHSKSGKDLPPWRPGKVFNRGKVEEMRHSGMTLGQIVAETGVAKTTVRRVLGMAK